MDKEIWKRTKVVSKLRRITLFLIDIALFMTIYLLIYLISSI